MATTSCSKSTVMAGKIRTKYNKYTVILRHNNKSKNVLNYKCRSLSDCETSKTSIGNFFVGGGVGWGGVGTTQSSWVRSQCLSAGLSAGFHGILLTHIMYVEAHG